MSENGENVESAKVEKGQKKILLTLHQYNKLSSTATPKSTFTLAEEYRTLTLQHLRWHLVQTSHLPKEYVNNPFCKQNGAVVPDDTPFSTYTKMNNEPTEEKDDVEELSLYYKAKKANSGMDEITKAFLAEKLDLSMRDPEAFLNPTLNKLGPSYKADTWKAAAGKPDAYAADMNEAQWSIVLRNNDLLCGKFFEGGGSSDKLAVPATIRRARHAAFSLKEREIPEYNITSKSAKPPPAGIQEPEVKFRIPRYQICDSSRVEVFETKDSISASLAENAFSQTTVEASAGGGAFGVSVGVKAGATTSDSNKLAQSSAKDESQMHVSYMFPRVEIFLDIEDLELTKDCMQELDKVKAGRKKEDADNFFYKFGHVFVPHVQLGGRLYSVEKTDSISGATSSEKASALKAAASASVSGFGFQAQVSASHETTQNSKVDKSTSSSMHSITWHADGGDTLLCNNPPAWCPTVHSYYNWRVMNQIGMIDILQVIGQMKGYEDLPKIIKRIYYADVSFKICLWDSKGADAKPYLGLVRNENVIETTEAGGGNHSRRAKRHALLKSLTGEEHMEGTFEISALRDQLIWEGTEVKHGRFKFGEYYPLRFFYRNAKGDPFTYGIRRTTREERYQKASVLYGGLEEEPNILVCFRNVSDDDAARRGDQIGSHNLVRMDFYDPHTKENYGWLQNDATLCNLNTYGKYIEDERKFKFIYV